MKSFVLIGSEADRIRPKEAALIAHVSVPMVYVWMNHEPPLFDHFLVKQRGKERGLRFIVKTSFLKFLAEQAQEAMAWGQNA